MRPAGDAQPGLAIRSEPNWRRTQPGGKLAAAVEVVSVADRDQQAGGGRGAHAALHQPAGLVVAGTWASYCAMRSSSRATSLSRPVGAQWRP